MTVPFKSRTLEIPDVIVVEPAVFSDNRGFFAETYKASDFRNMGIPDSFVQDNHSLSAKGVLRGIHYQLHPKSQGKLVRVVRGAVYDVALDMRKGSPYYGKWVAVVLSEDNRHMLWVPPGFGHGFQALQDGAEVLYKTTEEYDPSLDRGLLWCDSELAIPWPLKDAILSPKDAGLPAFRKAENNFRYEGTR
jgi:dTDP-4-dehydrorhamnose 3,5-epimerase